MRQLVACIFLAALAVTTILPQGGLNVRINEIMASNTNTIPDPQFNEYGDWVELYNPDSVSADISGYYLTDIFSQPQKWQLPLSGVTIPARGYLIIWCDDHNTGLHANFKLSGSGEMVGLYTSTGALVDTVTFGAQTSDVSYGRYPDGVNAWFTFHPASPGMPNYESNITSRCPEPVFSLQGGFFPSAVTVSLSSTMQGSVVRYTTDGSEPKETSPVYTSPVVLDSTGVIKAKTFKLQSLPSKTVTNSYLINVSTGLPVFSLSTDPANFFSDTSGIYVAGTNGITAYCSTGPRNWNQDWERPVTLEFFENDGSRAFLVNAGVKIYGGCTRLYAEKSLAIYMRGIYGDSKINYKIFKDSYLSEFNNLVLRNAGQDWYRTMVREGMISALIKGRMNIDQQEYRPAILFINGRYWGIHNIREKLNEHYIEYHYNIPEENLDLVEYSKSPEIKSGDSVAYYEMYNFLKYHDISIDANYEIAKNMIDIDEYIDYNIAEIFCANGDWPANNVKLWRERKPDGKWRWMIYDLDYAYNGNSNGMYNTNSLKYALDSTNTISTNPPWATMILRRLMTHPSFRNEFIQRMAAHIATTFEYNRTMAVLDSVRGLIAGDIPAHKLRWPNSISFGATWDAQIDLIREFAQLRPGYMRGFFNERFGLPGSYSIQLSTNDSTAGRAIAHTVRLGWNTAPVFFKGVPLKLWAMPEPGYRFVRWEGFLNQPGEKIEIMPTGNISLRAIFEPFTPADTALVINEINYKSNPVYDSGDWVEIFNPSHTPVDLSGYKFYDSGAGNQFILPAGTVIGPAGYLTLCEDTAKFRYCHPEAKGFTGNFSFGLSSTGETVYFADPTGTVLDSVAYSSVAPWDTKPNGNGYTLALINPGLDNSLPGSWKSGKILGTPSERNDVFTEVKERGDLPAAYSLSQNFPNPFNPETKIQVALPESGNIKLTVYDVLGNEVMVIADGVFTAGTHEFLFSGNELPSGVYFYRLAAGSFNQVRKMLLLK